MGGQRKTPARWQAQPGQAGSVLLAQDTRTGNASALRLAKLRGLGLAGATAVSLAAMIWEAPMGDLSPDVGVRLGRLVTMLSSPVAGEVVATAAAIGRTLDRAGMDWHDLAKRLTAPAQPQPHRGAAGADFDPRNASLRAMADWLAKYAPHGLTVAQRDFVANIRRTLATGRRLSPAQTGYLRDLHRKHGGRS